MGIPFGQPGGNVNRLRWSHTPIELFDRHGGLFSENGKKELAHFVRRLPEPFGQRRTDYHVRSIGMTGETSTLAGPGYGAAIEIVQREPGRKFIQYRFVGPGRRNRNISVVILMVGRRVGWILKRG